LVRILLLVLILSLYVLAFPYYLALFI